jgi:hypothetical protein
LRGKCSNNSLLVSIILLVLGRFYISFCDETRALRTRFRGHGGALKLSLENASIEWLGSFNFPVLLRLTIYSTASLLVYFVIGITNVSAMSAIGVQRIVYEVVE